MAANINDICREAPVMIEGLLKKKAECVTGLSKEGDIWKVLVEVTEKEVFETNSQLTVARFLESRRIGELALSDATVEVTFMGKRENKLDQIKKVERTVSVHIASTVREPYKLLTRKLAGEGVQKMDQLIALKVTVPLVSDTDSPERAEARDLAAGVRPVGLLSPTNGARITALALAPIEARIQLPDLNVQQIQNAVAFVQVSGSDDFNQVRSAVSRELDRLIAELESNGQIILQQNFVRLKDFLLSGFSQLALRAQKQQNVDLKALIAIDLPTGELATDLGQENVSLIFNLFGALIKNVIWTSSREAKVKISGDMTALLKQYGIRTPITDSSLKGAASLIDSEGQEQLGVVALDSAEALEALVASLPKDFIAIKHAGDLSRLDYYEQRALLLLKTFLAIAVAMDTDLTPAAILKQYGFEDFFTINNTFRAGANFIEVDLALFQTELQSDRAISRAA